MAAGRKQLRGAPSCRNSWRQKPEMCKASALAAGVNEPFPYKVLKFLSASSGVRINSHVSSPVEIVSGLVSRTEVLITCHRHKELAFTSSGK